MDAAGLRQAISGAMTEIVEYKDELRDLDTALGDGDLGITVSLGAEAIVAALAELPELSLDEVVRTCAKAFANANPSTMAALVAGALLAGSRLWANREDVSTTDASAFVAAAADSISRRGKSEVGDKTILDALVPAGEALGTTEDPREALDRAIEAAQTAVVETAKLQSRRGRASWLQERSIGLKDPGASALLRLLESWKTANYDGLRVAE